MGINGGITLAVLQDDEHAVMCNLSTFDLVSACPGNYSYCQKISSMSVSEVCRGKRKLLKIALHMFITSVCISSVGVLLFEWLRLSDCMGEASECVA